jgi:hypothetical protein
MYLRSNLERAGFVVTPHRQIVGPHSRRQSERTGP